MMDDSSIEATVRSFLSKTNATVAEEKPVDKVVKQPGPVGSHLEANLH